jgi:hypothetical protein
LQEAFAADVVIEDSSGTCLVTEAAELNDQESARRIGLGVESRRVMAVRGERLALVELGDPDVDGERFHRFVVEEADSQQRFVRIAIYGPDELAHAVDDFDRRWLDLYDGEHGDAMDVIIQWGSAFRHLDVEAAASLMADDMAFVDHRPMGYPSLDREGFLEATRQVGDAHGIAVAAEIEVITDDGYVGHHADWNVLPSGELVEGQVGIAVATVRDGLVANLEFFPEDDPDAAIARLDELTT